MRNDSDIGKLDSYIFIYENRKIQKIKMVKSYCHLPMYHHVKTKKKYERLSLFIIMVKKLDSMNKSKTKYEQIMMIKNRFNE